MKKLLFLLVLGIISVQARVVDVYYAPYDQVKSITVEPGDQLKVFLPVNPTTGPHWGRWQITPTSDPADVFGLGLIRLNSESYEASFGMPRGRGMVGMGVGAGGNQIYDFTVQNQGSGVLNFTYMAFGPGAQRTEKSAQLNLTVAYQRD